MTKLQKKLAEEDGMFIVDMRQGGDAQGVVVRKVGQKILMMRSVVFMVAILKGEETRVMMMTTIDNRQNEISEEIRDRGTSSDAEGIFVA